MVLSQPRVTGFLSPVGVSPGPASQSLPCGQRNPAPTNDPPPANVNGSGVTSPALPARVQRKSKKIKRAEKKAKRKRSKNLGRAKSGSTDIVTDISASTPTNSSRSTVNDNEISLLDRSLRDMLASGDESSHGDNTNDTSNHEQYIIKIESELVATRIALEGEKSEVARLKVQIELLEKDYTLRKRELDGMKKNR